MYSITDILRLYNTANNTQLTFIFSSNPVSSFSPGIQIHEASLINVSSEEVVFTTQEVSSKAKEVIRKELEIKCILYLMYGKQLFPEV